MQQGRGQVAVHERGDLCRREGPGLASGHQAAGHGPLGVHHLIGQGPVEVPTPAGPVVRERGQPGPRVAQQHQPGQVSAQEVLGSQTQVGQPHGPGVVGQEQGARGRVVDEPQGAEGDRVRRPRLTGQAQRRQEPAGDGLTGVALGAGLDLQDPLGAPGGADPRGQALPEAGAQEPVEPGLERAIGIGEGVDDGQSPAGGVGPGAGGHRLEEGAQVPRRAGEPTGQGGALRIGAGGVVEPGGAQHLLVAVGGVGDGHEEGERVLAHPTASEQRDEPGHHEVVDVGAGHPRVGELAQGLHILLEGGVVEGVDPAAGRLAVLVEEAAGTLAELAVGEDALGQAHRAVEQLGTAGPVSGADGVIEPGQPGQVLAPLALLVR